MPYTTVVAGTTITASWGNANVRDQVVTPFASASARSSAITAPVEGMVSHLNDVNSLELYNGSQWVPIFPSSATVATSETSGSTSYTDLATAGPAVTVVTGTSALVTLSAQIKDSVADVAWMAVAVSGASAVGAADSNAIEVVGTSAMSVARTFKLAGLTAGSNTFTAKYRVVSGTGTWASRDITIHPLP